MHQSCLVRLVLESEEAHQQILHSRHVSPCVSETVWMVPTAVPVEQPHLGQSSSDCVDRAMMIRLLHYYATDEVVVDRSQRAIHFNCRYLCILQ